jgi:hypothetical protein
MTNRSPFFFRSRRVCCHAAPPRSRTPPLRHGKNLTVVTRKVTPFVIEKNGRLTGYSVELLGTRRARGAPAVRSRQGLQDRRERRANARRDPRRTRGRGVAAVSITSEREKTIDFSYPFKESGLQILTKDQPTARSANVAKVFKGDIAGC